MPGNDAAATETLDSTKAPASADARAEIPREAITMVLYVSVVNIAEPAALSESHFAAGRGTGVVGAHLLAII